MNMALLVSCSIVVFLYIVVCTFGYLTVLGTPNEEILRKTNNILDVDY